MSGKNDAASKAKEMLLVQSKVKDYIRGRDMMCSSDLVEALNDHVSVLLDRAVERANSNNRKTARAADI